MTLSTFFGSKRRPNPRKTRLSLESLEDRFAPALLTVVPTAEADGLTRFTSLSLALSSVHSGDTIQIEPGSSPGGGVVSVDNVTIQGDASLGGAGGLQATDTGIQGLALVANGCTVRNLVITATIGIAAGKTGQTITNCVFSRMGGGISQTYSMGTTGTTNGGNTITGNTFLIGTSVQLGNSGSGIHTATNDTLANNLFLASSNPSVDIENETAGLLVAGNRFEDAAGVAIGLKNCVGTVSGNVVHATYPDSGGLGIEDTDSMAPTNLTVSNNVFTTASYGISVAHNYKTNVFNVALTNNTVAGSRIGLFLQGNAAGGNMDFGTITISGNDFRGSYAGMNSHAIFAYDPTRNTTTLSAQGNLFSVADPQTVVLVAPGFGTVVDTGNALSGASANLLAAFQSLAGGAPSPVQPSNLGSASGLQQAQAAVHDSLTARAFVDGLYVSLLGRAPGAGEDQGWVDAVVNGMSEEQLLVGFLCSPEFYGRVSQGSANPNGAWLQSLYVNLLGRQASAFEVKGWLSQLSSGSSEALASVANGVVNSSEFRGIQVQAMYGATVAGLVPTPDLLKRFSLASAAEVNGWLSTGLDLFSIEAMLLASPEFASNG
jgi:hypothetical protein